MHQGGDVSAFDLDEGMAVLSRTPAVCTALLEGLPEAWTEARAQKDAWSPREILAHLIVGERTDWIPRARIIVAQGEAVPFTPFDRGAHLEEARRETVTSLLETFDDLRTDNLQTLNAIA